MGAKDHAMMRRPRGRRVGGAAVLIAACWLAPASAEDEPALGVELNKLEDSAEGCRSVFVFDNRTGHELSRFRIDLILFDPAGVYRKQLLLDMAPLHADKRTVTSFLLDEQPCDALGSVLINDVPWCENGAGNALECVRMLKVGSLAEVPLHK
jgi:hypothetical protein